MPSLRVNHNNTRVTISYEKFPQKSVQFSKSFFPFFSKLWSSLHKNIKCNTDFIRFKENISGLYKPIKNRHFKYGSKIGNRYLTHLRVGRSFLNSHCFITGLSNTDICEKCNENKVENISHFVLSCPSHSLPRASMINKIATLIQNFFPLSNENKLSILLNGITTVNNFADCRKVTIMFAMQSLILSTKRFEKPSLSFIPHHSFSCLAFHTHLTLLPFLSACLGSCPLK